MSEISRRSCYNLLRDIVKEFAHTFTLSLRPIGEYVQFEDVQHIVIASFDLHIFDLEGIFGFWQSVTSRVKSEYPYISVHLIDCSSSASEEGLGLDGSIYFTVPFVSEGFVPPQINDDWAFVDVEPDNILIRAIYSDVHSYDSIDALSDAIISPGHMFTIGNVSPFYVYAGNKVLLRCCGQFERFIL